MPKKLLILKAASDVCASEVQQLRTIACMFGIGSCTFQFRDIDALNAKLACPNKFDFVYLGAHANTDYFGESDGSVMIPWQDLGTAFCCNGCLNPGAILMLGCCRGGLRNVAFQLFCACDQIDYICGPRWTVNAADISAGFHVFMYNMIVRREQPSTSVKRASKATGYDFFCHDRIELQREIQDYCDGTSSYSYGSYSASSTSATTSTPDVNA